MTPMAPVCSHPSLPSCQGTLTPAIPEGFFHSPPWVDLFSFSFLTRNYNVVWGRFGLINKVFVVVEIVLFSSSFLTRFYKGVSITRCLLRLLAGGDGDGGGRGGRATAY